MLGGHEECLSVGSIHSYTPGPGICSFTLLLSIVSGSSQCVKCISDTPDFFVDLVVYSKATADRRTSHSNSMTIELQGNRSQRLTAQALQAHGNGPAMNALSLMTSLYPYSLTICKKGFACQHALTLNPRILETQDNTPANLHLGDNGGAWHKTLNSASDLLNLSPSCSSSVHSQSKSWRSSYTLQGIVCCSDIHAAAKQQKQKLSMKPYHGAGAWQRTPNSALDLLRLSASCRASARSQRILWTTPRLATAAS